MRFRHQHQRRSPAHVAAKIIRQERPIARRVTVNREGWMIDVRLRLNPMLGESHERNETKQHRDQTPESGAAWPRFWSPACHRPGRRLEPAADPHVVPRAVAVGEGDPPAIATGVGGLPWEHVEPLLRAQLGGLGIPVFVYTTFQKGVAAQEPLPVQADGS